MYNIDQQQRRPIDQTAVALVFLFCPAVISWSSPLAKAGQLTRMAWPAA
jgi:hypothetical protein